MPIQSIKTKVLMLLLTITCVVVIVMALMMQFGFKQGFTQYKKSLEKDLNDRMVAALELHYAENQSWQLFSEDSRSWHELIFSSATARGNERPRKHQRKPSKPRKRDQRPPPPGEEKRALKQVRNPQLSRVLPSYSLFNQQQERIIGQVDWGASSTRKVEIKHLGQVVGFVAYSDLPGPGRKQDEQFNEMFIKLLIMITGVMILVALLFTVPVARYFTRPIQVLSQATQQAAAGDYSARTQIQRNDELGQLGQNFNLLTQTLESNAAIQKKLMADVSHELRTPVAVLVAQIEALQDGVHQADEKSLVLLHDQITALRHLINDLHQLSVTDLGSMQYQMYAVDINHILRAVVEGQHVLAEQKQISIKPQLCDQELLVLGDSNRLQQLFTNLVNNSIKYTDVLGQVQIISSVDEETGHVVVEIKDSEPGLQPHEMQQIFDRLYRQEGSRSKKLGGSGLGLAIAKNITEAHHGQIMAVDSDLGGVCLIVRIPKHV